MTLEIKNIKTDKDKYFFWEDKEIKLSFDIKSNDKDYNLNSVYINYWIEIHKDWKKIMESLEKLNLSNFITINYWNNQNFSCLIPIKIPNKKRSKYDIEYHIEPIEIKNIIEIIADIKLNPFDCKKKYYPNIEIINIDNWDFKTNENIEKIKKEIEDLIVITDEFNYNKIQNDILNSDNDDEIKKLEKEKEKYFTIKDLDKYDKLLDKYDKLLEKLSLECENDLSKLSQNELFIEKNDPNYININNSYYLFWSDYVSKDFYNYLVQNYKLFKFSRFFTNINFFITNIIFLWIIIYFYTENSSYDVITIDIVKLFPLIYFLFTLIYFSLINWLKTSVLNKIEKDILNINFKEKKYITEKFNNKTLKFNDIFENIVINYNWIYKCDFNTNLDCVLRIKRIELRWKDSRMVEYNKSIFTLKLAEYNWNNLSLNNIKTYDWIKKLEKIFIQPWFLIKKWFLFSNSAEIIYKISYNFKSRDLINKSWELIIW